MRNFGNHGLRGWIIGWRLTQTPYNWTDADSAAVPYEFLF